MFSKRHYEYVARTLLHAAANSIVLNHTTDRRRGIRDFAIFLTDRFERDEPNFNRARFLTACGIQTEKDNDAAGSA